MAGPGGTPAVRLSLVRPDDMLDVELVHAVQRPVIGVHGASSERVEQVAEWTDRFDRVEQDLPVNVPGTAPVLGVPIHLRRDGGTAAPSTAPGTFYDEDRDAVREVERFEFFDAHRPVFTETVLF